MKRTPFRWSTQRSQHCVKLRSLCHSFIFAVIHFVYTLCKFLYKNSRFKQMNLCKCATMMVNVDDLSQICCNLWGTTWEQFLEETNPSPSKVIICWKRLFFFLHPCVILVMYIVCVCLCWIGWISQSFMHQESHTRLKFQTFHDSVNLKPQVLFLSLTLNGDKDWKSSPVKKLEEFLWLLWTAQRNLRKQTGIEI